MAKNYDVTGSLAHNAGGFTNLDSEEKQILNELDKYSEKNSFACVLLSLIHCHYFYVGRTGRGLLCLCTANFLYIGFLIDLMVILAGKFRDKEGRYVNTAERVRYETKLNDYYKRRA